MRWEDLLTRFQAHTWLLAERGVISLAIFLVFWALAVSVSRVISRVAQVRAVHPEVVFLFARSTKAALLTLGVVTALGTSGVNVSALVASLGLTGFALGFALRDILSNFLAGVLILLYKPFHRGDHINMAGLEGTVVNIDLRYTMLEHEGTSILIPNSNLFTTPITVKRAGA